MALVLVALGGAPVSVFVAICAPGASRVVQPVHRPVMPRGPKHDQLGRLGRRIRLLIGRPLDEAHDRRVGVGVVSIALCLLLAPAVTPVLAVVLVVLPVLSRRRAERLYEQSIVREMPEIVDLYAVALSSGHTIATATREVANRGEGVVATALEVAVELVDRGRPLDDALEQLRVDVGQRVRPLTSALLAALRYGVPIASSLVTVAADLRLERRRQAEQAARRLPVAMLFPLVLCVLPAFALLTVVPVLVNSLQSLTL